jgi:hypothetical protein
MLYRAWPSSGFESEAFAPHSVCADREFIRRITRFVPGPRDDAIAKLFQRVIPKFVTVVAACMTIVPAKRAQLATSPILRPALIVLSIFPIAAGFTDGIQ